jgi:UDP-N-acetylmuramoylalanine--D-glutamate ligase
MTRALVLGLARSGRAATLALRRRGFDVIAHDTSLEVDATDLEATGARVVLGEEDSAFLDGVDLVVKSPGVPGRSPLVTGARERAIAVISEVELGARLLPNPIVGITGTNGKTTTTALLGAVFAAAQIPVEVAGNIGRPLTSLVDEAAADTWIVCELSSFQLEDVETLRPRIAVLLNLEPDHIDRHDTFETYRDAKLRIFEQQGPDDVAIVPSGFGSIPGAARRIEFSGTDALPAEPRIPGAHNRENAAAAAAAARAAGIGEEAIAEGLLSFAGVEHRIEQIAVVGGVRYVNDSKATNVAAAMRALASFPGARLHVILGGLGKHESYAALAEALGPDDRAYLIGTAAPEIATALDTAGVSYVEAGNLSAAVVTAAEAAASGDVVLLSPACASFDQFASYEERGEEFGRLVQKLHG